MTKAVAIVTGASQGIGRATAVRLAQDFSGLVLVARNGAKLESTANDVKARGAEPLVLDLDLSQLEAPDTIVSKTLDRFGRIDALLNIAGAVPQIDVLEMTDAQWEGELHAQSAVIAGTVVGNITVDDKLEIGASARLRGRVSARRIAIA